MSTHQLLGKYQCTPISNHYASYDCSQPVNLNPNCVFYFRLFVVLLLVTSAAKVSVASPIDQHQRDDEPAQDSPADLTTVPDMTSEDVLKEREEHQGKLEDSVDKKRSAETSEGEEAVETQKASVEKVQHESVESSELHEKDDAPVNKRDTSQEKKSGASEETEQTEKSAKEEKNKEVDARNDENEFTFKREIDSHDGDDVDYRTQPVKAAEHTAESVEVKNLDQLESESKHRDDANHKADSSDSDNESNKSDESSGEDDRKDLTETRSKSLTETVSDSYDEAANNSQGEEPAKRETDETPDEQTKKLKEVEEPVHEEVEKKKITGNSTPNEDSENEGVNRKDNSQAVDSEPDKREALANRGEGSRPLVQSRANPAQSSVQPTFSFRLLPPI